MQPLPGDVSPEAKREKESHPRDASSEVKKEKSEFAEYSPPNHFENTPEQSSDSALSGEEEEDEVQIIENGNEQVYSNASNQLVLYNPGANGVVQVEPVCEPVVEYIPPHFPIYAPPPPRILPSVGAFTVQCASCFKWRLIPTKEKYEEIRESILQQPFICERAREWRPTISCEDPADISQDGSRLWAIDKPNIAQPPPGWERLLRIRGEGSTRFADVYYRAPSGKRLRSMVEINKYLEEHPEFLTAGVHSSQFSFQIPRPLQENYVRKRPQPPRADFSMTRPLEPTEVNPLSWAGPLEGPDLQLGQPGMSAPCSDDPISHPVTPAKRKATRSPSKHKPTKSPSKHMHNSKATYNEPNIKVENPQQQSNSAGDL